MVSETSDEIDSVLMQFVCEEDKPNIFEKNKKR